MVEIITVWQNLIGLTVVVGVLGFGFVIFTASVARSLFGEGRRERDD